MSGFISEQIWNNQEWVGRVAVPWTHVIVLERIARAAGATRWYFARSYSELSKIIDELRGGSCVSFYFDDQLRVDVDDEAARLDMFDAVSPLREIVLGYPVVGRTMVEVDLVTGSSELSEALMHRPEGGVVFWGPFPSREGGLGTVTLDLVDEDGVLRRHPH